MPISVVNRRFFAGGGEPDGFQVDSAAGFGSAFDATVNIVNGGGKYSFKRERLRENGDAEAVMSNYYTLTWTFEQMSLTDFTWIRSTLLGGAGSVKYSSATLYNDLPWCQRQLCHLIHLGG